MENIKSLYHDINQSTIPDSIYKYLCSYSTRISSQGNKMLPYMSHIYYGECSFYCLEKYYHLFHMHLVNGELYDEHLNQLDLESVQKYMEQYSLGFNNGYNNFQVTLQSSDDIFAKDDNNIAFTIFSRVYRNNENGNFIYTMPSDKDRDVNKIMLVLNENLLYKSGYSGGEFYKAWEIILKNPLKFVAFFEQTEKPLSDVGELIDYEDITVNEKLIMLFKLGVIEFLLTKASLQASTNNFASLLSPIIGEKSTTIQSALNALLNNPDSAKNPLNSTKAVEKAVQRLTQRGITI